LIMTLIGAVASALQGKERADGEESTVLEPGRPEAPVPSYAGSERSS
jgi:hypothetical protein